MVTNNAQMLLLISQMVTITLMPFILIFTFVLMIKVYRYISKKSHVLKLEQVVFIKRNQELFDHELENVKKK